MALLLKHPEPNGSTTHNHPSSPPTSGSPLPQPPPSPTNALASSYLAAATCGASTLPKKQPFFLLGDKLSSTSHILRVGSSTFSVFYDTPLESSHLFVGFWTALLEAFPRGTNFGSTLPSRSAPTIYKLHIANEADCECVCNEPISVSGTIFVASRSVPVGTSLLRVSLSKIPRASYPVLTSNLVKFLYPLWHCPRNINP
ncbi:hypothetical protein CLU79DRAFT_746726 [Phycomyces nitens]|nr:hypothetical protein CLU79DRAFT_746726 [Phycomyces nitens]